MNTHVYVNVPFDELVLWNLDVREIRAGWHYFQYLFDMAQIDLWKYAEDEGGTIDPKAIQWQFLQPLPYRDTETGRLVSPPPYWMGYTAIVREV